MTDEPSAPSPDAEQQPEDGEAQDDDGAPVDAQPALKEQRLSNVIKLVGAILGTVLTATTLYFLLFPRGGGCAQEAGGSLGTPTVDQGLRYREFLRRTNQTDQGADAATLNRQGTMVGVLITANGHPGKVLPVRWTTLTDSGGSVPEDELNDQLALGFVADTCTETGQRRLFAQWPEQPGKYMVEVSLLEDDDQDVLATVRTPVFTVPEH